MHVREMRALSLRLPPEVLAQLEQIRFERSQTAGRRLSSRALAEQIFKEFIAAEQSTKTSRRAK